MRDYFRDYTPYDWRWGWLFRWGSLWIGVHYSTAFKRICINPLPMVTLWITLPGGKTPEESASCGLSLPVT